MAELDLQLTDLTSKLHNYHVEEPGLSFVEQKLKLNDEKDGTYQTTIWLNVFLKVQKVTILMTSDDLQIVKFTFQL